MSCKTESSTFYIIKKHHCRQDYLLQSTLQSVWDAEWQAKITHLEIPWLSINALELHPTMPMAAQILKRNTFKELY